MATTKTRKPQPRKRIKKKTSPPIPPPAEQRLVRTSERGVFQTCLHSWQWSYVERRKATQEAPALTFGNLIHQALELRYPPGIKRGPHPAKTFERLYEKFTKEAYSLGFRDEEGEWQDLGEIGVDMMENYVDHFGKDEEWKVLASEMTFRVPVFIRCEGCGGAGDGRGKRGVPNSAKCPACRGYGQVYLFTYVGTLDGLWENRMDGGIRINDYKTCKGDPTQEMRNVGYTGSLGLQPGSYWTFGLDFIRMKGLLTPQMEKTLDGMVFTYLRKGKRDDRPQDKDGYYLNKPLKADLLALYKEKGQEPLKKDKGSKPGSATVDDMIVDLGDDALQLGEISKVQPPPLIHREVTYRSEQERERYRARAIRQVKEMIELENGPAEDRIKEPGWMTCRMCQFKDACELHELDSSWEDFLEGSTVEWDPYAAHEIENSERS